MMKILLLEEDLAQQSLLEECLRSWGHEVTTCVNAKIALETYQQAIYPLVVLDLELAQTDGVTLCRQMRSLPQTAQNVILVMHSDQCHQALEAAIEEGANDFLLKPIHANLLKMRVAILERQLHHFTELTQTQQELQWFKEQYHHRRESEARYRELADSITDIFFAFDRNLKFTYLNRASENFTGISATDALGKSLYEIFPGFKGTDAEKNYLKVLQSQQPQNFIQTYQLKGKPIFFEINAYPFRNGFLVFAKDATYRKQMEDALKKSWDYLENLNNSLGDAIFTVNLPDQRIEYVNRAVEHIFGYTIEECIGESTRTLFPNNRGYLHFARKLQDTVKKQKEILRTEHMLKRKDGEFFTAEITTTFLREDDELTGTISIVRDITDRKQMEFALEQERASLAQKVEERTAELSRINTELERASQLKDEFLANMSHDLRTPLNAILGYARILKKAKNLDQLQREGLETIQSSGEHLLNLINDILDLSKIEAGRLELHPNEFHLPEFLRQIANTIRIRAEQKGIIFIYEQDPSLPIGVYTDEKRLREVLINLLDNAVKFTEKGSVRLRAYELNELKELNEFRNSDTQTLKHSNTQTLKKICFQIEDTGIGIASEQFEEIFLPFRQVGKQIHWIEGTGLGLAISQQYVKMMEGELKVKSTLGEGSTFWFVLEIPEIPGLFPTFQSQQPEIISYQGKQRTVLIVDDKRENLAVLMNILLVLGFEIIKAESGQACLETAVRIQPDVILLDLRMPGMDGFETARRIRALPEIGNVVIIAISASVFEETRKKSLDAGCDDFLSKPIEREKLLECLQTHLDLEWIYHDDSKEHTPIVGHTATALAFHQSLPPKELDILRKFAVCGNITRILEQLEKIEGFGEEFLPLVTELRKLAKSFQVHKIVERLESLEVQV